EVKTDEVKTDGMKTDKLTAGQAVFRVSSSPHRAFVPSHNSQLTTHNSPLTTPSLNLPFVPSGFPYPLRSAGHGLRQSVAKQFVLIRVIRVTQ
ncbi:MAG: hypothetical protein U9Q98_06040, partial [Bacteroidota bacterium]|nr:hypothetical protein [Bacteroidota bacterium]